MIPNVSNKDIILSIIHGYIKKSKSFTVHDVYEESKKYGCSLENFRIKSIVKEAYYPIYYKITPIVINDTVFEVYHKENVNPDSYNSATVRRKFKKIPNIKNMKRISSFNTSTKSKEELNELLRDSKIPVRYNVPCHKLREAGFRVNDPVQITFTKKYIELVHFKITPESAVRKQLPPYAYKIDSYNSLKIRTRYFIEQFGSIDILDIVSSPGSVKIFLKK